MLANVPRPGRDFAGLRRYLLDGHLGAARDPKRVAWVVARNLASDRPEIATKIMAATADLSVRVERPVYHLIVSFRPDERPSEDVMLQVAETTLGDIGLAEHQALIIGHNDTPNRHMHMIINRVHPETGVAWSTSHDYRRIERSMRRQSEAHGLIMVPGRHTQPEAFAERGDTPSDGEYQMLRKKQRAALPQWSKAQSKALGESLKPMFDAANSWNDVEQVLEAFGGELVAKGQGLVVTDHARSGYAKLSALGAKLRLKELEARFGRSWDDHRKTAAQEHDRQPHRMRPLVTEMDIVLSLYRMGLADRSNVDAVVDARRRKLEQAPVAVQIEHEMRQALRAAVTTPRTKRSRVAPRRWRRDREPEPRQ